MNERYAPLFSPTATPPVAELDALIARYEWFAPLRIVRERVVGAADSRLCVVAPWRTESSLCGTRIDAAAFLVRTSDDIIDRFLCEKDLRIVADEGEAANDILTEAQLDDEDEVVSEQLAEIYLAQGLRDRAVAIYRKLSLLNSEKSSYFAELIDRIENNN